MKIYAIGYERINESYKFYIFTSTFLDHREEIDESFYDELQKVFTIPGKNNKSFSGIYFDTI